VLAYPDCLERLEKEYKDLLAYKARKIQGRPLHFALWLCSSFSESPQDRSRAGDPIRVLLKARADLNARASYKKHDATKGDQVIELGVMHIAAGLGCVPALEALLEDLSEPRQLQLLNEFCTIDGKDGCKDYYTPLLDAAFCGKKDAAVWLLEKRANPVLKNIDGWTPLHWLASRGLDCDSDVEAIVIALLKHKASVHAESSNPDDPTGTNLIPLELAVRPGSQYPKHLLYLLAPSYQGVAEPTCYSFIEDLALMSSHSYKAAHVFAQKIDHMLDDVPITKSKAVFDSQRPNAVDCMASLLNMAPEAAAVMMCALMDKPLVESPGRHSIGSRAVLGGFFGNQSMMCAYQPDVKDIKFGKLNLPVKYPEWKHEVAAAGASTGTSQAWHRSLVQVPSDMQSRSHKVSDVETFVLLLPNILDIDIFMALSSARHSNRAIFEAVPVQAAVHCLWANLVGPVFVLTLLYNICDLLVLASWGLTPAGHPWLSVVTESGNGDMAPETRNSSSNIPRFWSVLMAGVLRDSINLLWWYGTLCSKWRKHKFNDSFSATNGKVVHSGLHSLWHPSKILDVSHNTNMPEIVLLAAKAVFVYSVRCQTCEGTMPDQIQAMLAVNFFMQCVKLIYMLRVSAVGGKKILVLMKTLVSGAMREMFLVAFLFFLAFVFTAVMLERQGSVAWLSLSLYRGLLFGDGAGLDNMGFPIEAGPERKSPTQIMQNILAVMAILGTITFIVILNMVIAIYSTEYGQLEKESELLFQRERAKYCCTCLLGLMKLRRSRTSVLVAAWAVFFLLLAGSVVALWIVPDSAMVTASVLLALTQVALQALMMRSDWFASDAQGRDGGEGPAEPHFLWICRRCDDPPKHWEMDKHEDRAGNRELEKLVQQMSEQIRDLSAKVDKVNANTATSAFSPLASPRPTCYNNKLQRPEMQHQLSQSSTGFTGLSNLRSGSPPLKSNSPLWLVDRGVIRQRSHFDNGGYSVASEEPVRPHSDFGGRSGRQ